jgi:hypothetical protein
MRNACLLIAVLTANVAVSSEPGKLSLAALQDTTRTTGCGCRLTLPKQPASVVLLSEFDAPAWLNVGDGDVQVAFAKQRGSCRLDRVGAKCATSYSGAGLKVTLRTKVVGVCAPDDESCEVADVAGELTAVRGSERITTQVEGICGC